MTLLSKAVLACLSIGAASAALNPVSNSGTSYTFLFQNNLNFTDDGNHVGAILLDSATYSAGAKACAAISETMITKATIKAYKADFLPQLSYVAYMDYVASPDQAYFIDEGVLVATEGSSSFKFEALDAYATSSLPVLCTNSQANGGNIYDSSATAGNEITVKAAGNAYTGWRNQKSFRFQGIPFGTYPERFTYSTLYSQTGQNIAATAFGAECLQYGSGSEDCLFLNIMTPYIPKAGSTKNLRPVHFWIYGGGFTGGASNGYDGGQLASREDIVTVTINYRLSTLGFFAVPGTNVTGNYGISDQITALKWVVQNIAKFGGDPNHITINGQSAGAGSVRILLGSPLAIGKFQGAWAMSNLGGGVDLGNNNNYGSTYSSYLTIQQSYQYYSNGPQIFLDAGCNQTAIADQIACLRAYNGDLTSFPNVARFPVQDGYIIVTPELEVKTKNKDVANVNVVFGNAADDGASFNTYNHACTTEVECIADDTYISQAFAQEVVDSGLFPSPNSGNVTVDSFNVSARIITDNTFRCVDQATVYAGYSSGAFKSAYYYQSERGFPEDSYNPNGLDVSGPVEPGYPLGDPELPYYKVHSSDLPLIFGTVFNLRDDNDLYTIQTTTAYFGSFVRSGQPNPSQPLLKLRDYSTVLSAVKKTGPWDTVHNAAGTVNHLNYPSYITGFIDLPQCAFLNYSINYYLQGGS